MEKWKLLIEMVLKHEGGFVDDPTDSGGKTYRGIASASHPTWKGWSILKKHEPLKRNQIVKDDYLDELVYEVYKKNYYIPMKIDMINDLMISAHVFCHGVNAGNKAAIKLLQKAINVVHCTNIIVDGIIGSTTLQYTNMDNKTYELGVELINQRNEFYRSIVRNKPSQKKFLNGWLNRVTGTTNTVIKSEEKIVQNILYADYEVKNNTTNDNFLSIISKGIVKLFKR